ncbi:MAG: hypothetical protein Q7U28_03805 [Aquabacterium sp.]|nr:hypothetical protein [Aquabacterium sp.]
MSIPQKQRQVNDSTVAYINEGKSDAYGGLSVAMSSTLSLNVGFTGINVKLSH